MAAKPLRTRPCGRSDARTRLRQAELYLEVVTVVLGEDRVEATVASGNAVLSGIASADAICCAAAGERHRGQDHRGAVDHLARVTDDKQLAGRLRDLLDLKDQAHYGLDDIALETARVAARKARQLLDVARERVR